MPPKYPWFGSLFTTFLPESDKIPWKQLSINVQSNTLWLNNPFLPPIPKALYPSSVRYVTSLVARVPESWLLSPKQVLQKPPKRTPQISQNQPCHSSIPGFSAHLAGCFGGPEEVRHAGLGELGPWAMVSDGGWNPWMEPRDSYVFGFVGGLDWVVFIWCYMTLYDYWWNYRGIPIKYIGGPRKSWEVQGLSGRTWSEDSRGGFWCTQRAWLDYDELSSFIKWFSFTITIAQGPRVCQF